MPTDLILQQTPLTADLEHLRTQLAAVRSALSEREADLEQLRTRLRTFEARYLRQVGILYAELDDLDARIAEREVDLYDSDSARHRAHEARQRAQDTHEAAFAEAHTPAEFDPPPSLKSLFRDLAKRIHPDFAQDDAERIHFTLLMARANHAYRRGDIPTLERLLDDHREIYAALPDDGPAGELLLVSRQLRHAQRDLTALETERQTLLSGDIAALFLDAETAARQHRDLVSELAASLREQIADATRRYEFTERQMNAHGR